MVSSFRQISRWFARRDLQKVVERTRQGLWFAHTPKVSAVVLDDNDEPNMIVRKNATAGQRIFGMLQGVDTSGQTGSLYFRHRGTCDTGSEHDT